MTEKPVKPLSERIREHDEKVVGSIFSGTSLSAKRAVDLARKSIRLTAEMMEKK